MNILSSRTSGRVALFRFLAKWTKWLQYALDLVLLSSAFVLAYLLRFDFQLTDHELRDIAHQLPYVVLLQALGLRAAGVNAFVWRYIGMVELRGFVRAAAFASVPVLVLRVWLPESAQAWRVPLSVTVMDTLLAFGGVLSIRIVRRAFYEREAQRRTGYEAISAPPRRTLLLGAGRAGTMLAREIQTQNQCDFKVVGFVDDDPNLVKAVTQGLPVLGNTSELPSIVSKHRIEQVVISMTEAPRSEIKRLTALCEAIPVTVKIIPGMNEILDGTVNLSRIRNVQIEDLLGRVPVHLDEHDIRGVVTGRVALITGAGGSIGSELARQVARFNPSTLLLVERAEPALFNIDRELRQRWPTQPIVPLVGDVGDRLRMEWVFGAFRPAIVLHAAAHKHVPLMESNVTEAVKNNVLATHTLARLAGQSGVDVFVLISTDKAVNPQSVMGASKRMAELVVQSLNRQYRTRFLAVRFGNVIGSAGSVIPIFQEQIRSGGPVTVTHPDMQRYFMTIPEASQLVLQAAAIGDGGEIFILDMGEPVRILDLANDTIRLSGFKPNEDIEIVFTGLRPGEKLFEELGTRGENIAKTKHPKIFIGRIAEAPREQVQWGVRRLAALAEHGDDDALRALLNALIPEAAIRSAESGGEARPHFTVGRRGGPRAKSRVPAAALPTASAAEGRGAVGADRSVLGGQRL